MSNFGTHHSIIILNPLNANVLRKTVLYASEFATWNAWPTLAAICGVIPGTIVVLPVPDRAVNSAGMDEAGKPDSVAAGVI